MIAFDKSSLDVHLVDAQSVAQIYSIEQQIHLTPWSLKNIHSCFENELSKVLGCFYQRELIGYAVVQIIEPEAELQNFAISKRFQQQGVGKYFILALIRFCQQLALERIMLEVRESNDVAIQLYRANGFDKVGERKGYYQAKSGKESALLMMKIL